MLASLPAFVSVIASLQPWIGSTRLKAHTNALRSNCSQHSWFLFVGNLQDGSAFRKQLKRLF